MLCFFFSYNKLSFLPSEIGKLTALVSLMIQHNQLSEIVENIGQLDKLEELVISYVQGFTLA